MDILLTQSFNAISIGSILLLVAIGLAIVFGLMNVINMAQGELIMIGAYKPCARFIRLARKYGLDAVFINVSFVGSEALAKELGSDGDGVVVTQVVPPPEVGRHETSMSCWTPDSAALADRLQVAPPSVVVMTLAGPDPPLRPPTATHESAETHEIPLSS